MWCAVTSKCREHWGVGLSTPINPFAFTGTSESWQMLRRTKTKGKYGGHISNTMSERLHFLPISVGFWANSRSIPKLIKRGKSSRLVSSDLTKYSKKSWRNRQMFQHLPILWVSCIAAQIIQWNFWSLSTLNRWISSGLNYYTPWKNSLMRYFFPRHSRSSG